MKKNREMKHLRMFSNLHVQLFRGTMGVLLCTFMVLPNLYGQKRDKLISLNVKDVSVLDVIKTINQLGNNCVSYKKEELEKEKKRVTLELRNVEILAAIDSVLNGTRLKAVVHKDVILIVPGKIRNSETVTLKGTVTDKSGNPLPGVAVILKGTTSGTATDVNGNFMLAIPRERNPILVFSFIGMKRLEYAVKDVKPIQIQLEEDLTELEEVNVISTGYYDVDNG